MPRGSGSARGRGSTRGRSHDAGARPPKRAKFEHDAEPAHARAAATGARIALDGEVEANDADLGMTRQRGPSRTEIDRRIMATFAEDMELGGLQPAGPRLSLRSEMLRLSARVLLASGEAAFERAIAAFPHGSGAMADLSVELARIWPQPGSLPFRYWRLAVAQGWLDHRPDARLRTFRRLCLSDIEELRSIGRSLPNAVVAPIVMLDLLGLAFSDVELGKLHMAVGSTLVALRLDQTDVTEQGLVSFAMAVSGERRPFARLEILSLRALRTVTDRSVQRLVNVLPALAMLDVRGTSCKEIGMLLARSSSGFAMASTPEQAGLFDRPLTLTTTHARLHQLISPATTAVPPIVLVTERARPPPEPTAAVQTDARHVYDGQYGAVYTTAPRGIDRMALAEQRANEPGVPSAAFSVGAGAGVAQGRQSRADIDPTWRRRRPDLHSDGEAESEDEATAAPQLGPNGAVPARRFHVPIAPAHVERDYTCGPLTLVRLVRPSPPLARAKPSTTPVASTSRGPSLKRAVNVEPCRVAKKQISGDALDDLLAPTRTTKKAAPVPPMRGVDPNQPVRPTPTIGRKPMGSSLPSLSQATMGRTALGAFRRG